ncbi:MAG: DciA family protein [Candidatus Margulisiibacteriota bacterium]
MTQSIGNILDELEGELFWTIRNCRLLALWRQVVDESIAKNTEPIKISNRTLYVSTSSPVWAHELSYLKREIIKKFNEKAGEEAILNIRFKADGN